MHSLRSKITLLTLAVTVIAVFAVTLLSVIFIRNAERSQSDQLLQLLCETGERNLDYYFNSVEKSLRKVSDFVTADLEGLGEEQLSAHMERARKVFEDTANKTNGVLTYYYRIDPEVSNTVKGFWYTDVDGKGFVEHEVTDISLYDTADTSSLVWFTVPKQTGHAVWLPPYKTENLEKDTKVISYNLPVYRSGKFIGVVGIEVDQTTVKEQVESISLYNNGYAFLTDAEGNLLFHPRIDLAEIPAAEIPETPEGLLSDVTFTHYTYDGTPKEAVWMRLRNGMRLYVSVPESETEGDWERLVRDVLILAAGVLLLAVLLTRFATGKITRPLVQLTEAAKKADEGDYDFTLSYSGRDEVGTLTKTFKHMADHMKAHISDLNRRATVDELTSVRNKGAFIAYLDDMQAKLAEGAESPDFALGVFDCDDLKSVNDLYGHDKGDLYLKTASRLICRVFQHSPVFRIGGDEFAVVLRNDDFRNRDALLAFFEKSMAETSAAAKNSWEEIHVSVGIVAYDPLQDHSVTDTFRRADKVMYVNKRQNKINV